ncbi:hypothetical protein DH2020_040382 [Rehmannia glutinosa]|uniref:H15 domain-containing protein n=1 Tax=Rehmannia glutinosa TaxID=99300 RepID=A0ABR0UV96_REHGL
MATEEFNRPSLPPYPQMIMEALDALKQAEGANKSSISKYMESKYGEMPPGHADLLSHHLNRMKDSGELLFIKNNYLKPGPDAPRAWPGPSSKPKESLPPGAIPAPAKPRAGRERIPMHHRPRKSQSLRRAHQASPRRDGLGEGRGRLILSR